MTYQYSFKDCLQRAERITWRVEDLIGGDKTLDFTKAFLPESLTRTAELAFLSSDERRVLNQIHGATYFSMFGLVEEFILPFILDHARPYLNGDDYRARAFLEFASEEAKHIHLFHRFKEEFDAGFPTKCEVIGPPEAIAQHVRSHPALSIALLTLHIEWMTQHHFLDSVKDDTGIDPQFKSLLLHHWMEEHQHAQLDALMVEMIAENLQPAEIDAGVQGYFALVGFFDSGMKQQTKLILDAFQRAIGRTLSEEQVAEFRAKQHQALRWTYLGAGISHPRFLDSLAKLGPGKREAAEAALASFA
jgi:hypothetical protein